MTDDTSAAVERLRNSGFITQGDVKLALAHIAALEARAKEAEARAERAEAARLNVEGRWLAAESERRDAVQRAEWAEAFGHVFHTLPDGRLDFVAVRECSELGKLHQRAAALAAQVAGLREALELIDNSISAGVTETDGPARVKADGDTRIEDGFIVGQFAIQFELIMKCVQNVCRQALAAAPAAPEKPYGRYTCPTCDGGGEIAPSAECPDCDGTGACVLLAPADKGGRDGT